MKTGPVIKVIEMECPPEIEEGWNAWYNEKHVPQVLKFKGFKRAARYKIAYGVLGDEEKYPCHFQHKIGDTFIYDGEKYIGRICPGFSAAVVPRMMEFFAAGPRLVPAPQYYYAFLYAPVSRRDISKKNLDGIGFRNVLRTEVEPPRSIASLQPAHAFEWPPIKEMLK